MNEAHEQAKENWTILARLAEGLGAMIDAINIKLDCFFAFVGDDGEVEARDQAALEAARVRNAHIITLTPAEARSYFPTRTRSFNLADATPAELINCCETAIAYARQTKELDSTLPC
jgi:hypothetical protein